MKFENSEFKNTTQHLDGNEFINCKFSDCELVFSATSPVSMVGCSFHGVKWTFSGSAALTLQFMAGLYDGAGMGGRELIEKTFRSVRENRPFGSEAGKSGRHPTNRTLRNRRENEPSDPMEEA